jgi:hypothetical protein
LGRGRESRVQDADSGNDLPRRGLVHFGSMGARSNTSASTSSTDAVDRISLGVAWTFLDQMNRSARISECLIMAASWNF